MGEKKSIWEGGYVQVIELCDVLRKRQRLDFEGGHSIQLRLRVLSEETGLSNYDGQ